MIPDNPNVKHVGVLCVSVSVFAEMPGGIISGNSVYEVKKTLHLSGDDRQLCIKKIEHLMRLLQENV